MELSINLALLALPVKFIESATKDTSRTGKYHAIKVDNDTISLSVSREEMLARVIIESKKVNDPKLLSIVKGGFAVVNGSAHSQLVLKSHTQLPVSIKFEERKGKASTPKKDDGDGIAADGEVFEEIGSTMYEFVGEKGKKWKAGLQTINLPECDVSLDMGDKKAEVKGADLQRYAKFAGAYAGKGSMSTSWSNILLALKGDAMQLVTTNGRQIGMAKFQPAKSDGDFRAIISCDTMMEVAKLINPELDVSIYVKSGSPSMVCFVQRLTFGNGDIGSAIIRVPCSAEKFHNFDGPISKLSFNSTIKVKTQSLRNICDILDTIKRARTTTALEIADKQVSFHKRGDEGTIDGLPLSLSDASGADMELDLSSEHLRLMAAQTEKEDLKVEFSGKTTMCKATLDENREVFFIPFKES